MDPMKTELGLAKRAIEAGDPTHAAHHAAAAISHAPRDPEVLALVDLLIDTPKPGFGAALARMFGGAKEVAPLFPDDGFAGNQAARARAHERRGELDRAFGIVLQIAMQIDDRPDFVGWAIALAGSAAARGEMVDHRGYLNAYAALGRPTMGLVQLRVTERHAMAPWAELGRLLVAMHPREPLLRFALSSIVRRTGAFEDALLALEPLGEAADALTWNARGFALRGLRRWDEAARAFQRAMKLDPDAGVYVYEIARVHFEAGRLEEARSWLERGTHDGFEERVLSELIEEQLDQGAPRLWSRVLDLELGYDAIRRLALGQEVAEPMQDATTNVLPQVEGPPPLTLQMGVSCLESPSVLLTLALRTRGTTDTRDLPYDYAHEPTPHPFEPIDRTLGVRMWERTGKLVVQALPPPPAELTARIDDLVRALWTRRDGDPVPMLGQTRAWRMIHALSDLDAIAPEHLMAAMIHPSAPDAWSDVTAWVFDRQLIAAMMLAAQDRARPWLASRRRKSLQQLLFSHPDWVQAAALLALRQAVLDEPAALDDARDWCERLLTVQPDRGHCPAAPALAAMLGVAGMPHRDVARVIGAGPPEESESTVDEAT